MKRKFIPFLVSFFLVPNTYSEENQILVALNEAKLKGKELHAYSKENESKTLKQLELPKKITKAAKKLQCDAYEYKYYELSHSDGSSAIYGVAQPSEEGVVIGRHITIPKDENLKPDALIASTKSCLEIHGAPEYQNILFATHLLSFTPNMFHVYQSINYETTIYVGTEIAKWKVDKGEISVLQ